ncbi:MAG: 50S ribosome-binding GTPase [Nanoarchaeota archaeon]|nr:50S ribosome-binding GTPase [Nanoarchaeota archaeon]
MKSVQVALIGLNNSGKSTVANKLQQKKELETEKFTISSFKEGGNLVYLADTPYNLDEPKEMIALLKESDACLLCVSAVDGVNPKLGELVLLLNFLGINNGVIAITKTDSSTVDEVEALKKKLKAVLIETGLKDAQIIGTSSITDEGFAELREELVKLNPKERDENSQFKMPIETAKEIKSGLTTLFGIIDSGKVKKYDKVFIMPWGKEFIVQEINLHGEVVEEAKAGDRVGIFFKGLYPWDVQTGDVLTVEGLLEKAKKLKLEFEVTNFFKDELRVGSEVKLNVGIQTFPVTITKLSKDGSEIDSAKPGDKVEIEIESKLPFAFEKNQECVIIHPEAHWRSIKVVGHGKVLEGVE